MGQYSYLTVWPVFTRVHKESNDLGSIVHGSRHWMIRANLPQSKPQPQFNAQVHPILGAMQRSGACASGLSVLTVARSSKIAGLQLLFQIAMAMCLHAMG